MRLLVLFYLYLSFLPVSLQQAACPNSTDARSGACTNTYKSLPDGNITRSLELYAGKLTVQQCIAHCGCKSLAFAGMDLGGHCFCGSSQGDTCDSDHCQRLFDTTNIPSTPTVTAPSTAELFDTILVTCSGHSSITKYGINQDNKLAYFNSTSGNVSFVATGTSLKVACEMEAYWGCRSNEATVTVRSEVKFNLTCPSGVLSKQKQGTNDYETEEFELYVEFHQGSDITSLTWKQDTQPLGSKITNVAEPFLYSVGGDLTTDRFETYLASFNASLGELPTFININFEFTAPGYVAAFEASITSVGCFTFQVYKPMCDPNSSTPKYCHALRECVTSSTGCGSPQNLTVGEIEFYAPASKPVFCASVERFMEDDNTTCPSPPVFTAPKADYELLYEFTDCAWTLGNVIMKVPDDKRFYVYPGYVLGWTPFVNNSGDIAYYSVSTNEDSVYPTFEYDDIFDTHVGGIYHHKHPTAKVFNNFHLLRAHVVSPTRYMKKMTLAIAPGQVTEFDVEVESPTLSPTVQTAKCKVDLQAMFISFELSVTSATPTVTPHTFRSRRSVIPVDRVVNVKKNAELTFTTSNPNTDYNVFFEYSWGDGTANHTMSGAGNVKKTYNKTGIYSVTIRGFNLISEVYENVTVYVYDDIKDNKFLRPIDPEPTGNISSATFMLIGDGNCTATYQLGDNSTARTLNVTLTDHFIAELEYVYATEGDYLIEIICSNPIDSKYINDYASVEDIITDLTLLPFPVAATNVTHHFELDVHPGTNTTCVWRWNDTTPSNASIVNQRTMSHMYTTYGNRTICIYCFNKISNQEICQFIEVQDIIQGLNFSIPVEPKAFKDTVSERKESQIIFYIEKGTGVTFQVNFDLRSTSASFKSDLIHNLDHRPNNKFLAYGTRKYAVVDYYPVSVYAENAVSNATIYGEAAVEREMTSADLILTQLDASLHRSQPLKEYFEVNETVHFEYKPNDGNSLLCFYNFSDKYEEPILTNKFKMNKSWPYSKPVTHEPPFPVPVEPFKVNITCWNNVSVVTKTKEVSVQKPVQNITGLVIKGGPENTTEKMDLCMKIDTGDDFNCTWTTSCRDCTDCTLFNTYKEYKNLRKDDGYACVAKCQFPTSGWYDVNVNCSNRLYWDTAKITVGSYSPVSGDYEVEAAYDEDCGTQNKAGSKGIKEGEEQASFAEGCKVKFSILGQSGYNTTYNYIFEPEEGGISTRRRRSAPSSGQSSKCSPPKCLFLQNFTVYSYKPSKEGKTEKTVTVNASNAVSWVVKTTKFYVIQRINNVSIENDGPAKEGQLVNFTFKAVSFGYKSCCLFDMGDPLSENRQFWIGTRETCEQNQQISEGIIKAKPDILKQNPTTGHHFAKYSHTFSWASIFIIRVECWNEVSREKYDSESNPEIAPVKILDKPCKIPELKYLNLEVKTSNPPTGIYKSDKYTVRTQIKLNCEKTNRVVYKWTLTNRTADGKDQVIDLIKTTENDTVFNIPKRRLDYGEYTLRCNASMYKVKGIWMEVVGFAKIRPSELWGEFQGGSGRADGQNKIIDIDSKPSHDPDDPDTQDGIHRKWYCKQDQEVFPNVTNITETGYPSEISPAASNISLNATKLGFKGCFGNGPVHFKDFDDQPVLKLNTTYMPIRIYYNIRLDLTKCVKGECRRKSVTYRLLVVPGDPPQINIGCKVNCLRKANPTSKLSLLANCYSGCSLSIKYEWSMFRMKAGEELEKVADEEFKKSLMTDANNKNLAIKKDALSSDYVYIVKLLGYFGEDLKEFGGFAEYRISMNTRPVAPDMSKIKINIKAGEPLKKIFKMSAVGFTDEDLPLSYTMQFQASAKAEWSTFHSSALPITDYFLLPPGDVTFESKVKIRVICRDQLGAATISGSLKVEVKAKPVDNKELNNVLADATDPQAANMAVGAVLSSMTTTEGDSSGNTEVLGAVTDLLANVEVASDEGALMVASSISAAVNSGPMDENAKRNSLNVAMNIANFVSPEMDPETLEQVGQGAISVAASVSVGLSGAAARAAVKDSDAVALKLAVGIALNKVPGEPPTKINSSAGVSAMSSLEGGANAQVPAGGAGIALPAGISGNDSSKTVGVSVSFGVNKYTYGKDPNAVSSNTVGIDLSGGFGSTMKVNDTAEPIELEIPPGSPAPPPDTMLAYTHLVQTIQRVDVTDNRSNIFLECEPLFNLSVKLFIFIKKDKTPTLDNHDWNITLPQEFPPPKNTSNMTEEEKLQQTLKWKVILEGSTNITTKNMTAAGTYYIGVQRLVNDTNSTGSILASANIFVQTSLPPVNCSFRAYTRACLYWDTTDEDWSDRGCQVSPKTNINFTYCKCNHMTNFGGGGVFAKPNPINFDKAFAGFSNLAENPTVFSVVLSLIGLYFILLAWCRHKDKKDIEKIGVFPLEDNHPSDSYFYEVAVQTGFPKGSGTTADVFIILSGNLGETAPRKLKNPNRKCFNQGEIDSFLLSTPFSLGLLKEIEIWHNNSGPSPGWYCMQIQIRDLRSEKKWAFVCNRWLDVAEDDGLIKRKLEVARKEDLVQFDFLFAQTARKNLYDGHLWFSIFTRPPRSTFTRCQRLACCLTLLMTTMLSGAMFYRGPEDAGPPENALHLGPITISLDQIRISVTSTLVVVPVNIIIVNLFQKARPKEDKKQKYEKTEEDDDEDGDEKGKQDQPPVEVSDSKISLVEKGELDDALEEEKKLKELESRKKKANFLLMLCVPGKEQDDDEDEDDSKKKKKKKEKSYLPHWVIYIGYVLVFFASGTSAFFVILYGFSFGKTKSEQWIQTMMLSFWQSVLIVQPIKVIALSVLFALILKDPSKTQEDDDGRPRAMAPDEEPQKADKKKGEGEGDEEDEDEDAKEELKKNVEFKLPDEKKLEEAREKRLKEKKMKAIIREIIIHLMFVLVCLFIGYSTMDPFAYRLGESVKNLVSKAGLTVAYNGSGKALTDAAIRSDFFDWAEKTLIPYLYPGSWYNLDPSYKLGFVADSESSKFIAMARMRQLRVKKNTCTKHPVFKDLIAGCNGGYSFSNEDNEQYSAGWNKPLNKSARWKLRKNKRKSLYLGLETPWQYQSVLKLKNFPFIGLYNTYGGSSYAVSIGPDLRQSNVIVKNMKDNFWIDKQTRAIFTEINIYNANTNLLLIVTFVNEILPTGGWGYFENIQALRLFRWTGGLGTVILLFDFIFIGVTLVGIYKLVKACKKEGTKAYLKNPWNLLHALVTGFSVCTIACIFARLAARMWAMSQYAKDPEVFVSFGYVGQMDYFLSAFIGFVVMSTNLEFLRLLRFNRRIGLLTTTMKQSAKPLASFGLMFVFLFMAYVSLAHFVYVDKLADFKSFASTFVALVKMFLGQFSVHDYINNAPVIGPFMFFSYMVIVQMILINMFIGIVCETFEDVRNDLEKQSNEHEIMAFMTNKFKKFAGAAVGPDTDAIYRDWKPKWQQTLDDIEDRADNVIYIMRNMEADEVRQNKWFDPDKADEKKKNMLKMLVGSDDFVYENDILGGLQAIDKKMKRVTVEQTYDMVVKVAKQRKKEKDDEKQGHPDGNESTFSTDDELSDSDESDSDN